MSPRRPDDYSRCPEHPRYLLCQRCAHCSACDRGDNWKGRVSTGKDGRTLCRECRYDDEIGVR